MDRASDIAAAFRLARQQRRALGSFPYEQPSTLEDAYAVQEQALAGLPGALAGWKIASVRPDQRAQFGTDRWAGPIVRLVDARLTQEPSTISVIEGGFLAVEAEFALLIGADLPKRSGSYSLAELVASVASMHVACEVAGSPLAGLSDLGATAVIADHGNNLAIIVGQAVPNWASRAPETLTAITRIDGNIVGEGTGARLDGGPIGALAFLVEHLASRGRHLSRGDWVSTGAITGVHRVAPDAIADLEFDGDARLTVQLKLGDPS